MANEKLDQQESSDLTTLRLQARVEDKPLVIKREFRGRKRNRESQAVLDERKKKSEAHARRSLDRKTRPL